MGAVVLDSSVVLASLDTSDAHFYAAISAIQSAHKVGHDFIIPASVLAEVLVGEARRNRGDVEQRRVAVESMFGPVRRIDEDVAVAAARLRAKHRSLRLSDALVIAVGIVDDAAAVMTADKRWLNYHKRVMVIGEDINDAATSSVRSSPS